MNTLRIFIASSSELEAAGKYTLEDLKYQFRQQLDRLEDQGIIVLREEVRQETEGAVAKYFNVKNVVIGSTITAGGNVYIGDKTLTQNADKIYNIEKIDNANFS